MRHWYIDGSRFLAHGFLNFLAGLDRIFAVRVTLHYFWRPLYGDYSPVGRVLGVIFRTLRVLIAGAIYAMIAAFFILLFIAWLIVPFVPLLMVYRSFFVA